MTTRWIAAAAVAVALGVAVFAPIAVPPAEREPDHSLRASVHDAFARRLQAGSEIVSTYGPWGILQRGDFDPRTRTVALVMSIAIGAAFAIALVLCARDAGAGAGVATLIAIAAAALLAGGSDDSRYLGVEFVALMWGGFSTRPPPAGRPLLGRGRVENPSHILLVALIAVIALIKLSYLVVALFVLAAIVCIRRRAVDPAIFAGTFVAAWMAAGQRIAGLPAFFRTGAEVVAGYADAQAASRAVTPELVAALAGAAGLVILVAAMERSMVRTAAMAAALFLTMKIAYVRYDDPHAITAAVLLPFLGVGYVLLRADRSRAMAIAAAVAVGGIIIINGPALLDRLHRREPRLEPLPPAPAVRGSIDAVPWGSAALLAHHLDYAPRPVFESHLAFTPALAELNARHFRTKPPMWLWVSAESIDGYPPLLADGPSWLEIFSRYDVASRAADHLLLRRRAAPLPIERQPLATLRGRAGEEVALPDAGDALLWCSIETSPSRAERIKAALVRPTRLTMRLDDQTFVVPAAMARGGFLLPRARRFRLSADFTLHLTAVRMPGRASGTVPDPSDPRISLRR